MREIDTYVYIAVCSLGTAVHSMKSIHRALNGMPECYSIDPSSSKFIFTILKCPEVSRTHENRNYNI